MNPHLLSGAAVATVFIALLAMKHRQLRKKLPPGPPLDPIIGGLRSMPSQYIYLTFADWSKKWGDVIYTSIFGLPVVILNSIDSARDLMDKRGSNYSDRPRAVVWNELISWDILTSIPYGERFRKHRRLMAQVLNSQAIGVYRDFQTNNTKNLLKDLLREPKRFDKHILLQACTTVVRVTYGLDVVSADDSLISLFSETIDRVVAEGIPGACPIDLFPILKHIPSWFPGASFQSRLRVTKSYVEDMKTIPFERVRVERRSGKAKPSLIGSLLDDYDEAGALDLEHEYDLKVIGAAMYAAGVETSATTMATFFQMMAKHPEVVRRAQIEIDIVTRGERLPTWDDRKDIPVVDCIMKEVFRIHPPVPIGIPHASVEEDTYRDMRIPRGATVIPNIWQMLHDPLIFPNPEVFDPERFREKESKLKGNSTQVLNGLDRDDPSAIVYGFGRRICPGRYFVDASLWLLMSNILAMFDIGPPLDSSGKPRKIGPIEYTDGATSRPVPFECNIRPRDAKCEAFVERLDVEMNL